MIRKLNNTDMNGEVFLWYNEILGEYFVGSQFDFENNVQSYHKDHISILYTMDAGSYAICNKIKNSLNSARVMVG